MKNKGVLLLEVLVAAILLLLGAGFIALASQNFTRLVHSLHYRNIALSLLRDVVEFGESDFVLSHCKFEYAYQPAVQKYESVYTGSAPLCGSTIDGTCCVDPFEKLGDILEKKYVPESDPLSVRMVYEGLTSETLPDGTALPCDETKTACKKYYSIRVTIFWTEAGRPMHEELLVAPVGFAMTQGLSLDLQDFWEE
ncbi:MAG TPA: hypothetical protein PLP56_07085 [Candidatus Omnitrophota bacterium]|nr:hypothetical protein [Candidatus Omnitrophota bacterium]HNQ50364.1 hypothetical protein [Candidatus Omnitrophota bacterium]HQO38514.1 hypothetical protein [Candidatus Omnitrophota bacterium]HQQ06723.1 hypothetical protein [Candidatus Omnitrophota bacterium]